MPNLQHCSKTRHHHHSIAPHAPLWPLAAQHHLHTFTAPYTYNTTPPSRLPTLTTPQLTPTTPIQQHHPQPSRLPTPTTAHPSTAPTAMHGLRRAIYISRRRFASVIPRSRQMNFSKLSGQGEIHQLLLTFTPNQSLIWSNKII